MNIKHVIVSTLMLAAAGGAFADTGKTRAEVVAELMQARADGLLDQNETNYPREYPFVSTLTREQVKAEVLQARADGTLEFNEADYPRTPAQPASHLTRAQVKADVAAARADGTLDANPDDYAGAPWPAAPRAQLQAARKTSAATSAQ